MKVFIDNAILGLMVMVVAAFASTANGQDINGSWIGTMKVGPYSRTVKFNINQTDDSASVHLEMSNLPMMPKEEKTDFEFPATIVGNELTIDVVGILKYQGTLVGDTIEGSMSMMGKEFPMILVRDNGAIDRLQEAAVGSDNKSYQDFVGSWIGATEVGPYSSTFKFNINQTDDGVFVHWDVSGLPMMPKDEMTDFELPATIVGNELTIDVAGFLIIRGTLEGDTIEGSISMMGKELPMILVRDNGAIDRPQEAAIESDNNKPYHSEEITFNNGDIRLAGTLSLPNEGDHFPAVVFVHGTGNLDRDENMFRHKPFLLLADALCRQGFAVLRYDKRITGDSLDVNMVLAASTKVLAEDAMAGLRYLMSRPEVDASQVGILGHSEGGSIAMMNAANYPDEVAFIVSMAGVGTTGVEIAKKQKRMILSTIGIEPDEASMQLNDQILEILSEPTDSATVCQQLHEFIEENGSSLLQQQMGNLYSEELNLTPQQIYEPMIQYLASPANRFLLQYDPIDYLKRIKCPMLAINGTLDSQVACEDNLNTIARLVPHATVKPYEGLNHMFQTCTDWKGSSNYVTIQETLAPQVITDIAEWLTSITRK